MDTNGHTILFEDYVSFEIAQLLKEKGFDEICSYEWGPTVNEGYVLQKWIITNGQIKNSDLIDGAYTAPSQSIALKWLREVHKLHIYAVPYWPQGDMRNKMSWQGLIVDLNTINGDSQCYADSFEEAIENRLKFALENLI